jgi:hypothetical protein
MFTNLISIARSKSSAFQADSFQHPFQGMLMKVKVANEWFAR